LPFGKAIVNADHIALGYVFLPVNFSFSTPRKIFKLLAYFVGFHFNSHFLPE